MYGGRVKLDSEIADPFEVRAASLLVTLEGLGLSVEDKRTILSLVKELSLLNFELITAELSGYPHSKCTDSLMSPTIQLSFDFQSSQPEELDAWSVPIDWGFPEEAANELARLESFNKHLYRPNTYLHKWWARRSGTTFRYILKQLVADPIKRDYYAPGGLEGKIILDPMMGGGTTVHEAIRMGANVIGVDIDPIPTVQAKATLSQGSLSHKKSAFDKFFDALRRKLGPLYRTTCPHCREDAEAQFVLYGLRRRCSCQEVLLVDDFLLRENEGQNVYICPHCREVYTGRNHSCITMTDTPLLVKGTRQCDTCGTTFGDILDEPFSERYIPLVVVGKCEEHGRFFKAIEQEDLALLAQARSIGDKARFGDSENFRIPNGPKSRDLLRRNINSFQELFTARQLLYLKTSLELLGDLGGEDRLWLALLVSTSLEFNSLLCGYKGSSIRRPGAIRHVFSHHAYSFPYTALENNPVFSGKASGTLMRLFQDRILKAGQWALEPVERRIVDGRSTKVSLRGEVDAGEVVVDWKSLIEGTRRFLVVQSDSAVLDIPDDMVDYVVTDPPYYDSVQYSDLSNFFRVWLRLLLPHEADWHYDPLASAVSEGDAFGNRKYGEVLAEIWRMCRRALKKEKGRLIFTFHHWSHEAWTELTLSLKKAGFVLVNRYVIFSENPTSVHIQGLRALKHDTVLVLRPSGTRPDTPEWPRPEQIDATDSYSFCFDCGTALGWFLNSDFDQEDIRSDWRYLLKEGDDAKG